MTTNKEVYTMDQFCEVLKCFVAREANNLLPYQKAYLQEFLKPFSSKEIEL